MNREEFLESYGIYIDDNGNFKVRDKENCKKLSKFLNDPRYGDINTGILNPEAVYSLYLDIVSK